MAPLGVGPLVEADASDPVDVPAPVVRVRVAAVEVRPRRGDVPVW